MALQIPKRGMRTAKISERLEHFHQVGQSCHSQTTVFPSELLKDREKVMGSGLFPKALALLNCGFLNSWWLVKVKKSPSKVA